MKNNTTQSIQTRYSTLANSSCCLSCGGAVNFSKIVPGEICADLGSGRGYDVIRMSELTGENGHVYGIDITEGMIEKAKRTISKLGISNTTFIKCELENILMENNALDVIISNCTINHSLDQEIVWSEIHRLLKPGGRFIVSDIYATSEVPEKYRTDPQAVAECWAGAVIKEQYLKNLDNAGFNSVDIIEESDPYNKGNIDVVSWTIRGYK